MKTLILTTSLIASILAGALSANAADRSMPFDAQAVFDAAANRGSQ